MVPAAGQEKAQSTARPVAANKDGRAEIDAHAAEWLKESDVPSVAVAFIKDRSLGMDNSLRGTKSRYRRDRKNAVQHGVAHKAGDGGDSLRLASGGEILAG